MKFGVEMDPKIIDAIADAVIKKLDVEAIAKRISGQEPIIYFKVKEAAKILELNDQTVGRYCRNGVIKATKVGRDYRISSKAIKEFDKNKENDS